MTHDRNGADMPVAGAGHSKVSLPNAGPDAPNCGPVTVIGGALFHARNRRGLGHLMRAYNIASALRVLDPHCPVHIHATRQPDPTLFEADSSAFTITNDSVVAWDTVVEALRPEVIVHDTTLTVGDARLDYEPERVLVIRRRTVGQHEELLNDPLLRLVSRFIVPHSREEFGLDLPPWVEHRTHFVGPIVRRPEPRSINEIRRRFGADPGDVLVTATVGGGGFDEQADRFFEIVAACVPGLVAARANVRCLVVLGPNYSNPAMARRLGALPNTTLVAIEPRLVDVIAASDLVIAEGGYNTVTEVSLAQVPAVFIPSRRKLDDQRERVCRVAGTGAALVVYPESPVAETASTVCALMGDPSTLLSMRSAASTRTFSLGNDAAAAVISSLRSRSCTDGASVR